MTASHAAKPSNDAVSGIGTRIRDAREALDLTQEALANRLGVTAETVAEWEEGERDPRSNRILMLAGVLAVSAHWLLDGSVDFDPAERSDPEAAIRAQLESVRMKIAELQSLVDDIEGQLDQM